MRRLLLVAVLALAAAPLAQAGEAPTIVKRIRTTKAELRQHINTVTSFRRSPGGTKGCVGYGRNRAGKALTWRCTFTSPAAEPRRCWGRWRLGKAVMQPASGGDRYTVWVHDVLAHGCES